MAQLPILPIEPHPKESIGQGLLGALGSGLEALASHKLKEMTHRQTSRGLQTLGFSPSESSSLAHLSPELLGPIVKQKLSQPSEAQYGRAATGLESLGIPQEQAAKLALLPESLQREFIKQQGRAASQAQQEQLLQQQGLPAGLSQLPPHAQSALIKQLYPQAQRAALEELLSGPGAQQQQQPMPQEVATVFQQLAQPQLQAPQAQAAAALAPSAEQMQEAPKPAPVKVDAPMAKGEKSVENIERKIEDPSTTPAQRVKLQEEKERRLEKFEKAQEKVDKQERPYLDELRLKGKAATETALGLDKMLQLVNTGKLVGPIRGTILETIKQGIPVLGIGADLFGLTSNETQEFKKIQADMLRNVKDWFGSRITNDEIKRFMDRIPSLNQSDEGKRLVIRDLKLLNQANIARNKAAQEIIEENGGHLPPDLEPRVEKRAKTELDRIANEFKSVYVSPQQLGKEYRARKNPLAGLVESITNLL